MCPDNHSRDPAPLVQRKKGHNADKEQNAEDVAVPLKAADVFLVNCFFHDFDIPFNQSVKGDIEQFTQHQQAVDKIQFPVYCVLNVKYDKDESVIEKVVYDEIAKYKAEKEGL